MRESLTLEYKASGALTPTEGKTIDEVRDELAKDVSAFANAAGGQIVYGMRERGHRPRGLDDGLDAKRYPGLWFDQILSQKIQPRIEGLVIREIPLSETHHAIVLTIPAATSRAPHQAPDGKYYRRRNFQGEPMADYEIREAMRRTVDPDLRLKIGFGDGTTTHLLRKVLHRGRCPSHSKSAQ